MRKAKDERARIASALFRISFDEEEDDVEKGAEASLGKESEINVSQMSSSRGRRFSDTKVKIVHLTASDPELSDSALYAKSCTLKCLQSSERSVTSKTLSNRDECAISDCYNTRKECDSDVISSAKIEARKLTIPMEDPNRIFSGLKCEDFIARASSSIEDHPLTRKCTSSIATSKSTHSKLTPSLQEVPAETSEHSEHFLLRDSDKIPASSKHSIGVKGYSHSDAKVLLATTPAASATTTTRNSLDEKSSKNVRRSTLPITCADLGRSVFREKSTTIKASPTFEDILAGTSVNPIRKFSIANAAICSSLAPSLLGAIPGVPNTLLPNGHGRDSNLRRSATLSDLSTASTSIGDDISVGRTRGRRLRLPFLRLHIPEQRSVASWHDDEDYDHFHHNDHHHHYLHHVFPHIHVPHITFTAPATDAIGRKFNFAIRRLSQVVSWCNQDASRFSVFIDVSSSLFLLT